MYDAENEKSNPEVASVEGAECNQPSSSEKAVEQLPETNHIMPVQKLVDLGSDTEECKWRSKTEPVSAVIC